MTWPQTLGEIPVQCLPFEARGVEMGDPLIGGLAYAVSLVVVVQVRERTRPVVDQGDYYTVRRRLWPVRGPRGFRSGIEMKALVTVGSRAPGRL